MRRVDALPGTMYERALVAAVGVGAAASVVVAAVGSQTMSDGVIAVCAVAAGILWLWRATRLRAFGRRPWFFLALGYASWGIAETGWVAYDLWYPGTIPQPSAADPFYVLGYILLSVGLLRLIMARSRRQNRGSALDALALTIALGTILVQLEIVGPGGVHHGVTAANAMAIMYALLDVPLLGGIVWLALTPGRRGLPLGLLLGAFTAMYLGDVLYALGGLYYPLGVAMSNVMYPLSYLLAAAAAVHPDIFELSRPHPDELHDDHVPRLVFLSVALVLPATLELTAPLLGLPRLGLVADVITIVISTIIVIRMARLLRETSRAQARARTAHLTLQFQATRDHLTGLYNRAWLLEYLDRVLDGADGDGQFAILYIDLDGFKLINDDLGHNAGDEMLCMAARRLVQGVRAVDQVVRLGGDEFVVICPPSISTVDAESLAARLVSLFAERFQIGQYEVTVTASVGVLTAMTHSDTTSVDLLRDADTALYRAKEVRSTWRVFNAGMRAKSENRLEILSQLRAVIRDDDLQVVYQPIVDLASGRIVAVEALSRLTMPDGREIPPLVFVGIAESTGVALMLDVAVLTRALGDLQWLDARCGRQLGLAVNISASEIAHPGLVKIIQRVLAAAAVDPGRLTLEVTETAVVKDLEAARMQLVELRELGVGIVIDDFGTGYSSMAYLHSLPICGIKIDRSFVQGVFMDANQALITEGMVRMGAALGLHVVGEGVEERQQAQRLLDLGCEHGQGFLFGRPMSRWEILERIAQESAPARSDASGAVGDAVKGAAHPLGLSVGVPLAGTEVAEHGHHPAGIDHELEEMPFNGLVGPPAVLDDPFVADRNHPASAPRHFDGMGGAGGGADYSCGPGGSEMS